VSGHGKHYRPHRVDSAKATTVVEVVVRDKYGRVKQYVRG